MSVTINAHQLKLLLDKTANHMGSEYNEALHGIRLDVDAKYLYAVASDRFTLAAARYQLNANDQQQEPWARTIPGEHLRSIREWIDTMKGAGLVTISAAKDRLLFEGPQTDLSIAVSTSLEFPDWRGVLRKHVEDAANGTSFPALNSNFLARFNNGDVVRVRMTADDKPLLVFADDFLGAQMPARNAGIYPCKEESFDGAHQSWLWTLAAGSKDADLSDPAFADEDRSRYDVTTDIRETGETLLDTALRSVWEMSGKSKDKPDEFLAHCLSAVHAWMAYRYLDALYNADPRAAQAVVAETAGDLEDGEIGEFAWEAAEQAGFTPQKWHEDYKARKAEQAADTNTAAAS